MERSLPRIEALDGLRGLAALTVVVHHLLIAFPVFLAAHRLREVGNPVIELLAFTPLHLFWAGREAVMLFFVLSGFVLALPFVHGRRTAYWRYAVKRVFRIWLPYMAVVAASIALQPLFYEQHGVEELSSWFNGMWAEPIGADDVVGYLVMNGEGTHNVDTTIWSLVHEMRVSLVFPLLMLALLRLPGWAAPLLAASLLVIEHDAVLHRLLPFRLGSTVYYATFFVLGAGLAQQLPRLRAWAAALGPRGWGAVGLAFIACYTWKWWTPWLPPARVYLIADPLAGVASLLAITAAMGQAQVAVLLRRAPLQWLGRISYSLYLVHPVVLLMCVYSLEGVIPLWLVVTLALPASLLVAHLTFHVLEHPAQQWGRTLAGWKPRRRVRNT